MAIAKMSNPQAGGGISRPHSSPKADDVGNHVNPRGDAETGLNLQERTIRNKEMASSPQFDPPKPLQSDKMKYLQLLASHFCIFNSWGIINTFGVFQTHYMTNHPPLGAASAVAWIGSIQSFLLLGIGPIAGKFCDAGYVRGTAIFGTILVTLGLLATSFVKDFAAIIICQGIIVGIGSGCLFAPPLAIIPHYFTRHRSLAFAIAASGAGIGGVVYPILVRAILLKAGFPWAVRAMMFVVAATQAFPCCFLASPPSFIKKPLDWRILDLSLINDHKFMLYHVGVFFVFMGLFTPYFFIDVWAERNVKLPFPSYYLLSIMNAGGTFGRVLPAVLADLASTPALTQGVCILIASILTFSWLAIHHVPALIFYAAAYGFFSGGFVALIGASVTALTADLRTIGARMGMSFAITGVANLVGNPVAGKIVEVNFAGARIYSAVCGVIGAGFMVIVWKWPAVREANDDE